MPERSEVDPGDVSRLMEQARGALGGLREQTPATDEDEASDVEIEAVGEADDGHVKVVLDDAGKVASVQVDRHARGTGTEELAANMVEAYNTALQNLQQLLAEQRQAGAVADPYELNEKLLDAQVSALRQSLSMIDAFDRSTGSIARAAGTGQ